MRDYMESFQLAMWCPKKFSVTNSIDCCTTSTPEPFPPLCRLATTTLLYYTKYYTEGFAARQVSTISINPWLVQKRAGMSSFIDDEWDQQSVGSLPFRDQVVQNLLEGHTRRR